MSRPTKNQIKPEKINVPWKPTMQATMVNVLNTYPKIGNLLCLKLNGNAGK